MSGRIEIEGLDELQRAMRKASKEAKARVARVVTSTAINLRADVVKRIQRGPASGAVYIKTNPSRTHTASAPGQSPASDTGRLANSIEFDQVGPMTATVGSKLVYAAALEFGTDDSGAPQIEPRPAWVPAVEKITPKFMSQLRAALVEAF